MCGSNDGICLDGMFGKSAKKETQKPQTEGQSEQKTDASGADDSLQKVLDAGKLVVGAEGNWEPYVFHNENGELDGFEVAMAGEIAKKLGVELDMANNIADSWDGVLAGTDEKDMMWICSCAPTPERKDIYTVSEPYGEQLIGLVVKKDNEAIKGLSRFKGEDISEFIVIQCRKYCKKLWRRACRSFT